MMNLKLQIISLVFSFFYGMLFSLLVNINYELLFKKRKRFRIIFTFSFIFVMALIYFFILNKLNNGIIHIYFLILIVVGFYISFPISKHLRRKGVKKK